jgi:hypothetical protein
MRFLAAVVGSLALAACTPKMLPPDGPQWHKLGGGSVIASSNRPDNKSAVVTRCWKTARGMDCLNVEQIPILTMTRTRLKKLPANLPTPGGMAITGYSCSSIDEKDFNEKIVDDMQGELDSHSIALQSPDKVHWTRAFVEGFLADHKVMGPGLYVNCPYLRDAIRAGSLQSVDTASVSYRSLTN